MSIVRIFPNTITSYIQAMNIAKAKKDGFLIPTDNILSDATSARLDADVDKYNNGKAAIVSVKQVYHHTIELAKPHRNLMKTYIRSYYKNINTEIDLGTFPASVRAFFGLEISNRKMPDMQSDATLITAATALIDGDAARILAGGAAIASPSIAQVTTIINTAKPFLFAVSNAKTKVTTAISNLKKQNAEIKDLIKHIWNEVESFYSLDESSSKRDQGRLWGIKYRGKGLDSVITGLCSEAITSVAIPYVQLYLVGVGKRVHSGLDGNYSINTSLYDVLELIATGAGYEDKKITFTKEDGVPMVVNVIMVKKVV